MAGSRLAIVVPAFNEVRTIGALIEAIAGHGVPIVVDDGSLDGTGDRAASAGAVVVRHSTNRGYDAALNSGFRRADEMNAHYVVTVDADGQHPPSLIPQFVEQLAQGAGVVIGIRDRRQRWSEHVFAWIARGLYGVRDPLCGMKGYRIEVYRQLGHVDCHGSIGSELALYAARSGCRVAQIPVPTRSRADVPRVGAGLRINMRILRAAFNAVIRRWWGHRRLNVVPGPASQSSS